MSAPGPIKSETSYRPDIDGIRAIAILSVVLYHSGLLYLPGGFTGVDIFFVISGYLIGGHIFSELESGRFSFLRFYYRRAKRILPAYYFVLAFTLIAGCFLLSPTELRELGRSAIAATLSASNLVFWHFSGYFDTRSEFNPLLMTWSLGVEEQFYLVVPLCMLLLTRLRRNWLWPAIIAGCILSFVLAVRALPHYPTLVFYMLPPRAWELGAGVALAVAEFNRKPTSLRASAAQVAGFAGLAMIVVPTLMLNTRTPFPGWAALPSVLGTALVIGAPASWVNRRILSLPPLVFVGRVSYSFYLWHWPILAYLRIANGNTVPWIASFLAVVTAFALAVLSFYFIEQPCRRSKRLPSPLLVRYAILSAAMLLVCSGIWVAGEFPPQNSVVAREDLAAYLPSLDPCLVGHDKLPTSSSCYDPGGMAPKVALWGDSHAAALAPAMRGLAQAQGFGFVQIGKTTCLPMVGAAIFIPPAHLSAGECLKFNRGALDMIVSDHQIRIVILTGVWRDTGNHSRWVTEETGDEPVNLTPDLARIAFQRSLRDTIQHLESAGKKVVVVDDVPGIPFDPLMRFRTEHIPARNWLAGLLGSPDAGSPGLRPTESFVPNELANTELDLALTGVPDIMRFDPSTRLCSDGHRCIYQEGDHLLYWDESHLTAVGSSSALRGFHFPSLPAAAKESPEPAGGQIHK
jgi:peptidoglycan/LPS O-acetylase OafA/YrhL